MSNPVIIFLAIALIEIFLMTLKNSGKKLRGGMSPVQNFARFALSTYLVLQIEGQRYLDINRKFICWDSKIVPIYS
jgi:hypothetical protein